ncbi:hypothetical protein SLS60_011184 [Paraconiothyrium brasiliense]|uniref:Uncharacterized protein n=1 Tax=Paraconiothyrium brasiliense TaxID=300254 RepID=A0ABR3QL05_9PLEO
MFECAMDFDLFPLGKRSNIKRITSEQFDEGRDFRFGTANPEKIDIAYWKLAVGYYIDPWWSREYFLKGEEPTDSIYEDADDSDPQDLDEYAGSEDESETETETETTAEHKTENDREDESEPQEATHKDYSYMDGGPIWCNLRFGQTTTELPDGTVVKIAGEHEDFYDPDFQIYNDVIVYPPGASQAVGHSDFVIYGYPEDVFPVTDFHTATYIPHLNKILVLGNMSSNYCKVDETLAASGVTPVYLLEVGTWKFEKRETHGDGPGMISRHVAELVDGVLRVTTGDPGYEEYYKTMRKVFKDGQSEHIDVESGTVWELRLDNWTWKQNASEQATLTGEAKET